MDLALIVLLPLAGAFLPLVAARAHTASAWAATAVAASALALTLRNAPAVFGGETLRIGADWIPALGLRASFMLDGLGLLFALLITVIGLLIILYARYYLAKERHLGRFYALLLFFMGAMLGVVLADNVLVLVVFWELTSLSSFLLIGYWNHREEARRGARMALVVTGAGGLALLAGLLLLGYMAESMELSVILESGALIQNDSLYLPALVLILLGVFTKSAQCPTHFWLPAAMAAPTPVSAYLHSATMVKAGVFLLARLFPALAGTDAWFYLVGGVGLFTLVFGAYTALFQHDLKGLLAYSTISHLGLITLLFGMGTPLAAVAGVFHIINHATFKASLFMAAGIIDHEAGTRDMLRLNGLWSYMPHTATLAMVAAAAMAGVPLLNGFLSKEMFFSETLALSRLGEWDWILPTTATLAGIFSVAYSVRFIHDVFFNGEPINLPRTPKEPPRYMKIPVEILVGLCLLVGILPALTIAPLLEVAATGAVGEALPEYKLDIWHGLTPPLAMSAVALIVGGLLYTVRYRLFNLHDQVFPELSGQRIYVGAIAGLLRAARRVTHSLENHSLQRYVALLLIAAVIAGAAPFLGTGPVGLAPAPAMLPVDPASAAEWLLMIAAALATVVFHRQRLVALIFVGVAGLMVSLTFARLSAPDLALTQLSVEVVTMVLFLLALYFLPQRTPPESSGSRKLRDAAIAVAAGLGLGGLTWMILSQPHASISDFYLARSLTQAGGANVVNVILVDFRGFDTLGEITVLTIAGIAAYAMLYDLHTAYTDADATGRPWSADPHPLILATTARILLPMALLVSIYLLLRGHHQPGGGFIAALVTAAALIVQYLANGTLWTRQRLTLRYRPIMATGLLFALLTGIGSLFFGAPFLTSAFGHFHWPVIGDVELASALVFDIGVYLTVIGAVTFILARLGFVGGVESPPELQGTNREGTAWRP